MINAQKWLDKEYPKEKRGNIRNLDLSNRNLEGELNLIDFTNLFEVNINGNPHLGEIKNKREWARIKVTNAQEWLDREYPRNTRRSIKELDINNKQLEGSLDLSDFIDLEKLNCSTGDEEDDYYSKNQLTSLNVSKCRNLTELNCSRNYKLTDLNTSKNTQLRKIECKWNKLTNLDVSKNSELTMLVCSRNELVNLNVSRNQKIVKLLCDFNKLTSLNVSNCPNLEELNCGANQLNYINLKNNSNLIKLFILGNKMDKLNADSCPKLVELRCQGGQISKLEIRNNPYLTYLNCSSNKLTTLDIGKNTSLNEFYCGGNQLKYLELSQNAELTRIDCSDNFLTDASFLKRLPCPEKLTSLTISDNNFTKQDLSFLEDFVNLTSLWLGNSSWRMENKSAYNRFYGSLKFLQNMSNLKSLSIDDTDIDSGLEYLPENLKEIHCSNESQAKGRSSLIKKSLEVYEEWNEYRVGAGTEGIPHYSYQKWRENNLDLIEKVKKNTELEKEIRTKQQLKEISEIVLPNTSFDFMALKTEIKKLKFENLIYQIKNKKIEIEQLTNIVNAEKLTAKTKKELQKIIQDKQKEINKLENQLESLQGKQEKTEAQIEIPPKK